MTVLPFQPNVRGPRATMEDDIDVAGLQHGSNGGGCMGDNKICLERLATLECKVEHLDKNITETRSDLKTGLSELGKKYDEQKKWIIGTGLAIAALVVGIITWQSNWTQKIIDANNNAIQTQINEFRRDSDRNYDLTMKALEKSFTVQVTGPVRAETAQPDSDIGNQVADTPASK